MLDDLVDVAGEQLGSFVGYDDETLLGACSCSTTHCLVVDELSFG